eukprot:9223768-Heterocapsa_arctica.AAC.1
MSRPEPAYPAWMKGPKLHDAVTIASCNVTSLRSALESIVKQEWDVLAVQESRLDATPSARVKGIRGISSFAEIQAK